MTKVKFTFWLFLLLSALAHAEQSQFIGKWCSNPCFYGTTSRPWNLPCGFEITEDEIRWEHHTFDDRSKILKFSLKYIVLEKKDGEDVLIVSGGGKREWYDHESFPGAKHKITLSANHSNKFAAGNLLLSDEAYCEEEKKWCGGGSVFIRRTEGPCP